MARNIEYEVEQSIIPEAGGESSTGAANTVTATTPNNNTLVVPTTGQTPPLSNSDILVDDITYSIKVIAGTDANSVQASEANGSIIYENGNNTNKEINNFFNVKLSNILLAPKEIPYNLTIKKNGYVTNQKFVFIASIKRDKDTAEDASSKDKVIPKNAVIVLNIYEYRDNVIYKTTKLDYPNTSTEITFLLKKGTESGTGTLAPTNRLTIINNGITDSIIVLRNNKDGVKLTNGSNVITGTYGDTYTIKSNDLSRFAISKWEITDSAGIKTEKVATPTQSLSIDLTINVNVSYSVTLTVTTPDLRTISKIPQIVVENKDEKLKYNINSRQDFELKIQKNEFVERVTVFISNEVYEYRDLNNKDTTASIRIPFFAFKQIGNFKVYLVPSSTLGDGARVETIINVVDDEYIPVPDLRRIKYPSTLYGADYKGTDIDFEISWESINTNFVRIYNSATVTAGSKYVEVASNSKITLNVKNLILLNPSNYKESNTEFKFELSLVPYNTSGREVVIGKKETIPITFKKSDKTIPKSMAINRIAEAFASKFDTSVFEKETSKYLTHNLHFESNIDTKVITTWTGSNSELILKLYEPLPKVISTNEQVWISKIQSNPIIETITLYGDSKNYCTPLKGPNFELDTDGGIGYATYSELIASGSETSNDLINKYANSIGIDTKKLSIEYVSNSNYVFENFVNFSSAEERLENFFYKIKLIQQNKARYEELSAGTFQAPYEDIQGSILVQTTPTHPLVLTHEGAKMVTEDGFFEIQWEVGQFAGVSQANEANKVLKILNNLINNLDGWEKFLYEDTNYLNLSYPKELYVHPITGLSKYILKDVNDTDVITWYNYLKVLCAFYDKDNPNNLVNNLPEHITIDYENNDFMLFLNMIGQHFDILWTYINAIKSTKLLEEKQVNGINNDLVSHMLKSLGWDTKKAFQSDNLWEYAFGKTKDGYTKYGMSLEEANNQVWRRILNNLPYLLKNKGTGRAMKAIMACYGVPQSMLTIMEFGGPQDPTKNGTSKFTFEDRTAAFYLSGSINASGSSNIKIPWKASPATLDYPNCIELRILPKKLPNTKYAIISGSDWSLDLVQTTGSFGKLELNFGGDQSTSTYFNDPVLYPNDTASMVSTTVYISPELSGVYAFGPDLKTGSLDFPISLENYSQILINRHNTPATASWFEVWLATTDGRRITTFVSMSLMTDDTEWEVGSTIQIGGDGYEGMVDEFRLWEVPLKRAKFENHTLFPNAINGNSYTASTADLIFRLDFEYPKNRKAGDNGLTVKDISDPNIKNVSINTTYGEDYAVASNMYSATKYPYQYIPYDRDVTADVPSTGFNYSNKIRFESSSLVGDLSYKNRATRKSFDQAPIDSNRLGIFLSPIKELNMDILKAFGDEFNIDNYIGDPSDEDKYEYKELATLREYYFDRLQNRDIYEYIQLVRYIDKSLFDVLEDLAPARAKVSKGLLIEPHFLERSKTKWTRPIAEKNDYESLIDYSKNQKTEFEYSVQNMNIDGLEDYKFDSETPFYDTNIDGTVYSDLDAQKNDYESVIDYNTISAFNTEFPTYPNTGSANVNCLIEGLLEGEVDVFEHIAIGMDKNSLSNAGFGLYAKAGNAVVYGTPEPFGFSDWKSGSRASIFLVKEQYTKFVKTQLRGYPTTRSLTIPGEQVYYEKVPVTKYKYTVSNTPFSSSISLGGGIVEVTALNGYFPTHYKYVNNLSEGMQRSFWKGSKQELINGVWTTPDLLPAVEVFGTNPLILRVAKTGRGSGEPILEVD
jgi:hypothetical protein